MTAERPRDGFWPAVLFPPVAIIGSIAAGLVAAGLAYAAGAGDDTAGSISIAVGSAGILGFGLLVVLRRPRHLRRMAFRTTGAPWRAIGVGFLAGVGCLIASGVVIAAGLAIDPGLEKTFDDLNESLRDTGDGTAFSLTLVVVALVVFAPLGEELLFRGILLRGLTRRLPFGAAALVTAAAFAAVHFDQYVSPFLWPRTVQLVCVGIILALVYRSRGYWAAVTAHAVVNGTAAIALFAAD
jgi:membrane protease YdiL (CAAX protease family)